MAASALITLNAQCLLLILPFLRIPAVSSSSTSPHELYYCAVNVTGGPGAVGNYGLLLLARLLNNWLLPVWRPKIATRIRYRQQRQYWLLQVFW